MTLLPLRFKILYVLNKSGGQPMTTKAIFEGLGSDYQGEGQFSLDKMEEHLMAVKATALIEGCEPYIDEAGEARYKYSLTDEGRKRIKFLPKQWQN
jgi:hypothetical protein